MTLVANNCSLAAAVHDLPAKLLLRLGVDKCQQAAWGHHHCLLLRALVDAVVRQLLPQTIQEATGALRATPHFGASARGVGRGVGAPRQRGQPREVTEGSRREVDRRVLAGTAVAAHPRHRVADVAEVVLPCPHLAVDRRVIQPPLIIFQ
jgi:hypothetical protein